MFRHSASPWKVGNTIEYNIFSPEKIKSSDPVVYDNNGNIIPLSERFNQEKSDIRFSLVNDIGDTSLSPIDYRRSVDPLFDFFMEQSDSGVLNPGVEHEGEDFTGSYISQEYKAFSVKRRQGGGTLIGRKTDRMDIFTILLWRSS